MGEDFEDATLDTALISAAQRVEYYEIAGYGTVIAYADLVEESGQASLLRETLEEEKATDEKLTELAKQVNAEAQRGDSESRKNNRCTNPVKLLNHLP